ncbi:proline-specific peptidase [Ewingella americana]|uniref:Proline-specific peptidase n=1 Tax=Ewingella americana TaxID=41202 RepID=A0A377NB06_9GAMM|nr:proline-specific peptidase [Ewingella americana]
MKSQDHNQARVDEIHSESLMINSDTPGISLHLRHKYLPSTNAFTADNTLVMVHGATYSSGSLYDVRLDGVSFMDALALRGLNVYAVDVRGYGHSTRPAEMDAPPLDNPPLFGTETGVRDLGSAVDWVRQKLGLERVQVFGMSWGGSVAAAYTSQNNEKVNRLVVLAPQWVNEGGSRLDEGGQLGAYRRVAVGESRPRWVNAAPEAHRHDLIPDGWFEAWAAASLAEEPQSQQTQPPTLRAVNGTIQDVRDYWGSQSAVLSPAGHYAAGAAGPRRVGCRRAAEVDDALLHLIHLVAGKALGGNRRGDAHDADGEKSLAGVPRGGGFLCELRFRQ